LVAYRLARLEREGLDKDDLQVALAAYGAALDRLKHCESISFRRRTD
jgi:hypothetical protein